jgi:hypothetical protein
MLNPDIHMSLDLFYSSRFLTFLMALETLVLNAIPFTCSQFYAFLTLESGNTNT